MIVLCLQFMKKADRSADGTLDVKEFQSFIEVCCVIDESLQSLSGGPNSAVSSPDTGPNTAPSSCVRDEKKLLGGLRRQISEGSYR